MRGNIPLHGEITIQGSKNATLPILAACILIKDVCVIHNCPAISDVFCMIAILESVGCKVVVEGTSITVDARDLTNNKLPSDQVTKMRSSVIVMGALLGRTGEATLDYPGGCVIGERPIDIHLEGFRQLGINIDEKEDRIKSDVDYLLGTEINLPFPSVGATENIILTAVMAEGTTKINNAAREPEVQALCEFINTAGGNIEGIGEECLIIHGRNQLHGIEYSVPSDRIVAGTYLLACQAIGGAITLKNAPVKHLDSLLPVLEQLGSEVVADQSTVRIRTLNPSKSISLLKTTVYPGFPTDLQSQLMVVLALAEGKSQIEESIFDNRFKIVEELQKMGANIIINGNTAFVTGVEMLQGELVEAKELRGGAALVIAGLAANGVTEVKNLHFIQRGYVDIVKDLSTLGADIAYG